MFRTTIFNATVNAAVNSNSVNISRLDTASVQVNVTNESSPNGSVTLQASNDDSTWIDVTGSATNITDGSDIMLNLADVGYKYLRAAFARTSGSWDAEVIVAGKERKV